jgi:hypothetical protein
MPGFTLCSVRELSRRTINAALEARIAEATSTAFGDLLPLSRFGQITNNLAGVDIMYNRPGWHQNVEIVAGTTGLIPAGTAGTALGLKPPGNPKISQGIERIVRDQVDASTVPAIATVRPTPFNVLLTPKTQRTVTAVPRLHANTCLVDEFHKSLNQQKGVRALLGRLFEKGSDPFSDTKNPALAGPF